MLGKWSHLKIVTLIDDLFSIAQEAEVQVPSIALGDGRRRMSHFKNATSRLETALNLVPNISDISTARQISPCLARLKYLEINYTVG